MLRQTIPLLAATLLATTAFVPVDANAQGEPGTNQFWWPERVDLSPLRAHDADS
jgi:catalase-peroxidase